MDKLKKMNNELTRIEDSIKRKYLQNKAYLDFLNRLHKDTQEKHNKLKVSK